MTDIALLFSRDPLKHTDADIDEIIKKFREARVNFGAGDRKAGSTTPAKLTAKEQEVAGAKLNLGLNLKDLL